ncbi:hypothetical protein GM655_11315 [Pseudoduganella danionis]|uniref:Transmembrane protein n=1 Tax=Pseudoduganella danionis TaxID=1890295 RepID=A0ABW9SN36_9BURK|nr:hypothetical protein [Pseudoduganella danionis]
MKWLELAPLLLRGRLALARAGAPLCIAVALMVAGMASWLWLVPQHAAVRPVPAQPLPALVTAPAAPTANQNLADFYAVLGPQRYAEQQVKVLFDLAAKNGLVLNQGEYKTARDVASGVTTYQITLPVQGPYQAIWQFALQALRTMPFAALDEVAFRREQIGEPIVEARLRLTLYLKDGGA